MTTQHDSDRSIRAWLDSEAPDRAPDDVVVTARERIRTTSQRRPIWPIGRYLDMSNYAKLAAAGVAVAVVAVGTAFVFGGATGPGASPMPTPTAGTPAITAAPTDSSTAEPVVVPAIAEFTACAPRNAQLKAGTNTTTDAPGTDGEIQVEQQRGFTWSVAITASDPRFTGTHYYSYDSNAYAATNGERASASTFAEGHRIETAEGAWTGWATGVEFADGTRVVGPVALTGEGAYAGLGAVMVSVDGGCFFNFRGSVMEIPTPPVPSTGG